MIERAINQGWDTPVDEQRKACSLAIQTLNDEKTNKREKLAALRVIGAFIEHGGATDAEIRKRAMDAMRYQSQTITKTNVRPI